MKKFHQQLFALTLLSFVVACKSNYPLPEQLPDTNTKLAPDGFNFETAKKLSVNVRLLSNVDEPLKGIIVDINRTNGETLLRGATDENGYLKATVNIPSYIDTLSVNATHTGLIQDVKVLVVNNNLNCVIGGSNGASGNIASIKSNGKVFSANTLAVNYTYMGSYDYLGRPVSYLDPTKGTVSAEFLTYLNESLPDSKDVRTHHPQYLSDNATEHLRITKTSDVWVTFVSEGGNYASAIGYYTYNTNNPPNNTNQIGEIKMVFPNTAGLGSGGNMRSGDRVKLGSFTAGKSIGFVLFQNGWKQNLNTVNTGVPKFYSDSQFNPEGSAALRTHTVLLNFAKENLFVIGFEDLLRDGSASDHDFNDVVLYANSVPTDAISTSGVQGISPPKDTDSDGVWDVNDKFPTDATRAFINYFPSQTGFGTLAFEDNWPSKGDYDMNDLVINYRYNYISNASNKVVEIKAEYYPVAAIAKNQNGFGVQFPFSPSIISSVSGQKITENYITQNANGTEAGQSKAVIIPFDNHTNLITNLQGIDSAIVRITFTQPVDPATLGTAPFNPFLICNRVRGIEAHLPGQLPTEKADPSFFGTDNDKTNPATNKYYLSAENWPWALSFTEQFRFPYEGNSIDAAYLHFGQWASSGGTQYTDWYKNTAPGYRDVTKIH